MGQSFFDKLQAKLELFRLEKRYTRSRHRRSAFVSNAVYVDGEYVFQTPNSTGSSSSSKGIDALHGEKATEVTVPVLADVDEDAASTTPAPASRKKLNRYSSMPGFGGSYNTEKQAVNVKQRRLSLIR